MDPDQEQRFSIRIVNPELKDKKEEFGPRNEPIPRNLVVLVCNFPVSFRRKRNCLDFFIRVFWYLVEHY